MEYFLYLCRQNINNRIFKSMNSKSAAKLTACASLALFLSGIPSQKACAQEQEKKVVVEDADNEKRYLPANSISVSSGYSWLSNEFLTDNGDKLGTPTGFDVTMEYAHLWKLKNSRRPFYIGFSINGVGSRTKLKIPRNGADDVDEVIMNYFVGAGYKMAYKTNKRFIWNLLLSLGYACTDDGYNTADGFGVYSEMGCEYMLSKHWSAGVTLGGFSSTYKQPAGWDGNKYRYGIDHNGLRAKLAYYF